MAHLGPEQERLQASWDGTAFKWLLCYQLADKYRAKVSPNPNPNPNPNRNPNPDQARSWRTGARAAVAELRALEVALEARTLPLPLPTLEARTLPLP